MLKHRRSESIMQYFSCLCCYFYSWNLLCWTASHLNNCWKGAPALSGETKGDWGLYLHGKKEDEKGKHRESKSVLFIWTAEHELNHTTWQAIPAEIAAKSLKVSWDEVPHSLLQTPSLWWPWTSLVKDWWSQHFFTLPCAVPFWTHFPLQQEPCPQFPSLEKQTLQSNHDAWTDNFKRQDQVHIIKKYLFTIFQAFRVFFLI